MEIGKYYRAYDTKGDFWIIFKPNKDNGLEPDNEYRCNGIVITSDRQFNSNGCCYKSENGSRDYREANEEEADWLDYCIQNNKYMSVSEYKAYRVLHPKPRP